MATFNTSQKYLDLYGLQLFWSKVKAYISSQKTNVVANHAKVEDVDKVWVDVTAGGDGLTYTIDDTAINAKFGAIDQELSEIKASAGVTKVTVEDASNDKTNYVTLKSNNDAGTGDITLTLNDTALETKISALEDADTAETAARKAADALLAGDGWNKVSGTWDTEPDYKTITKLSQQLKAAETSISALSNAVQFLGVSSTEITNNGTQKPTIDGSEVSSLEAGDVVFYGNKEFIWDGAKDGAKWIELGDTTLENQRLGVLEAWVGNGGTTGSYITNADINAMFEDGWSLPEAPADRN